MSGLPNDKIASMSLYTCIYSHVVANSSVLQAQCTTKIFSILTSSFEV